MKVIATRDFSEDPKWPALIETANSIRNVLYEAQRLLSLNVEPGDWDDRLSRIAPALRNIAGQLEARLNEASLFKRVKPGSLEMLQLAREILNRTNDVPARLAKALAEDVLVHFQGGSDAS